MSHAVSAYHYCFVSRADGLSLGDDIQGAEKVLNHVENTLFDKYDFTHTTIASATVGKDSCAFSFWQRKVSNAAVCALHPSTHLHANSQK